MVPPVKAVVEKFNERATDDLTQRDELAVQSAIIDALVAGYRQGFDACTFAVEAGATREGKDLTLHSELHMTEAYDPWAEKYGEGAADE